MVRSIILTLTKQKHILKNAKIYINYKLGWSYGFDGHLAKAPKYQEVPYFKKEENGLYPVHVHIDELGFVWINLDAKQPVPTVPWEQDFATVDAQPRLAKFNMEDYQFDHEWQMTGDYNWKVLADNYNEVWMAWLPSFQISRHY